MTDARMPPILYVDEAALIVADAADQIEPTNDQMQQTLRALATLMSLQWEETIAYLERVKKRREREAT